MTHLMADMLQPRNLKLVSPDDVFHVRYDCIWHAAQKTLLLPMQAEKHSFSLKGERSNSISGDNCEWKQSVRRVSDVYYFPPPLNNTCKWCQKLLGPQYLQP